MSVRLEAATEKTMNFNRPDLTHALDGWIADADVHERACAHNVRFDERISSARVEAFEGAAPSLASASELRRKMIDFYRDTVLLAPEHPYTFSTENEAAGMITPSAEQRLIRLENLREPLDKTGVTFDELRVALQRSDRDAIALVDWFCGEWSTRPDIRRNPVSFATFKDEHLDVISDPDWALLLRDRLGLRHFDGARAPIPLALMEYEVDDVIEAARRERLPASFRVPTSFDSMPY